MHKSFIFIALAFFLSDIITHVEGGDSDIEQNVADLSEKPSTSTDIKPAQTNLNKFNELELKLERRLEENVKTKWPQQLLQMDNMLTKINENVNNHLDGQFIQQILEESRLIFVSAKSILELIISKLRILTSDPVIKGEVIIHEELLETEQTAKGLHQTIDNHFYIINSYHGKRANLLKNLKRSQGDDAVVEFDQKFIDELKVFLVTGRNFGFNVFEMFDQHFEYMLTRKKKSKIEGFHDSIYT
uniref:Uncharacterized protein n=1 Tax=Globodera pallida TaxID=36090 RepID=A0A183C5P4_GLOPA